MNLTKKTIGIKLIIAFLVVFVFRNVISLVSVNKDLEILSRDNLGWLWYLFVIVTTVIALFLITAYVKQKKFGYYLTHVFVLLNIIFGICLNLLTLNGNNSDLLSKGDVTLPPWFILGFTLIYVVFFFIISGYIIKKKDYFKM